MNIVFLDTKTLGDVPNLSKLQQFGNTVFYQTTNPNQTAERVREAAIVITNKVVIDKEVLAQAPALKLICVAATGTNNVDKEAAAKRGIQVKNVTGYANNSVAQLTFAVLLQLINQVYYFDNYVKQGGYAQSDIFTHLGKSYWEINGKQFGIIGLGNIGRQVATIATAFKAEVVYYSASGQNQNQPYRRLELDDFLKTSDIISIHAPLNEYTTRLISYDKIKLMKKTAILINTGRGGIINEADLARALDENLIAGAGIDVFEQEPIKQDNPLLNIQNKAKLILTPHIAWASTEARTLLIEKVCQNIRDFLSQNS